MGIKNGEAYRFEQPLGKQYTFLKNPEHESEQAKLKADNRNFKQQIVVIKKYAELERKWLEKRLEVSRDTPRKDVCYCLGDAQSTYFLWNQASINRNILPIS